MESQSKDRNRLQIIFLVLLLLICLIRIIIPERPMNYIGPRALLDSIFSLVLLTFVIFLAHCLGLKICRWLNLREMTSIEQTVFIIPLGLGVIAYGVLLLGLLGFLFPLALVMWLVLAFILVRGESHEAINTVLNAINSMFRKWRSAGVGKISVLSLGAGILLLTLMQAMTPPWDYDGLMYHLKGAEAFLTNNRIVLLPEIWGANGPFTIEMLFLLGLGFGSDVFAKLIHLTFAVLLIISTFNFGSRYIAPNGGWIAAVILLGIPIYPIWASLAYVDIGWALYEFLAVYALLLWLSFRKSSYLLVSGLMMGLALGAKYLALGGAAVLGLTIIWINRRAGWKEILFNISSHLTLC